ncbi:unnamed protein product [Gemmata massiliana]|uniref:Uncharacterized protein n=1 Tax=Gemmata massiliana TaxID=1210884 RepID=A0A6P2D067_9BACT|nr:hypothetical protein [Gemmata massiliana]VTR93454.1 unnamed protein product [Gemmata massiliana]
MTRSLVLGWSACLGLALSPLIAFADIPPGPSPSKNRNFPATDQPRRGLFRSCGSGMGAGLAGIGLAWGTFWIGSRLANRTRNGSRPRE